MSTRKRRGFVYTGGAHTWDISIFGREPFFERPGTIRSVLILSHSDSRPEKAKQHRLILSYYSLVSFLALLRRMSCLTPEHNIQRFHVERAEYVTVGFVGAYGSTALVLSYSCRVALQRLGSSCQYDGRIQPRKKLVLVKVKVTACHLGTGHCNSKRTRVLNVGVWCLVWARQHPPWASDLIQ